MNLEQSISIYGVDVENGMIIIEGEEFSNVEQIEKRYGESIAKLVRQQIEIERKGEWTRIIKSSSHPQNIYFSKEA